MKIGLALETTFEADAGVQQFYKGLGRYLLSQGHDVKFITPYAAGDGEFKGRVISLGKAFTPPLNATSVPIGLISPTSEIKKALRENFDVIHVGLPVSPFSLAKLVKHAQCPLVGTFMSHSSSKPQRLFMRMFSSFPINVSRYFDILVAPNTLTTIDANHIVPGNYRVIPHATDSGVFKPSANPIPKFDNSRPKLLFLGRLEERKGLTYLLHALSTIKKTFPDILLVVAGDGPDRESLKEMTDDLDLSKNVSFEGYIDESDKPAYYASADLCVFPATHGECFGIVLIEALSSGKIPIAFENEGYKSVLENIPEALVENRNTSELAQRILELLQDPKKKKALERKCLAEAKRYTWASVGKEYLKVYHEAVRNFSSKS